MIQPRDRSLIQFMVRKKVIRPWCDMWGSWHFECPKGFEPVLERMRKRQAPDPLHHAPKCPANRWGGRALVFRACNCGAAYYAKLETITPAGRAAMDRIEQP